MKISVISLFWFNFNISLWFRINCGRRWPEKQIEIFYQNSSSIFRWTAGSFWSIRKAFCASDGWNISDTSASGFRVPFYMFSIVSANSPYDPRKVIIFPSFQISSFIRTGTDSLPRPGVKLVYTILFLSLKINSYLNLI